MLKAIRGKPIKQIGVIWQGSRRLKSTRFDLEKCNVIFVTRQQGA